MSILEDNKNGNLKHYDICSYVGKEELVKEMSILTGFRKKDISAIYDALWITIAHKITNDEGVDIPRFGKFYPITYPERKRYDGKNKRYYIVPESQSVKFKFDGVMKKKINQTYGVKRGLGHYAYIPKFGNYDYVFGKAPDVTKYGMSHRQVQLYDPKDYEDDETKTE